MYKDAYKAGRQEASWCYQCLRRKNCEKKELAAMEQKLAGAISYLDVTVKCYEYAYDSSVKPNTQETFLEKFIRKEQDLYSWDANPWVWVIEFERCEKPESEG